jgi:hypothetical protein
VQAAAFLFAEGLGRLGGGAGVAGILAPFGGAMKSFFEVHGNRFEFVGSASDRSSSTNRINATPARNAEFGMRNSEGKALGMNIRSDSAIRNPPSAFVTLASVTIQKILLLRKTALMLPLGIADTTRVRRGALGRRRAAAGVICRSLIEGKEPLPMQNTRLSSPRLKLYCGPEPSEAPLHDDDPDHDTVTVAVGELVPLLADAIECKRTWLEDFECDDVTISRDFYEVLSAYQFFRRPSA